MAWGELRGALLASLVTGVIAAPYFGGAAIAAVPDFPLLAAPPPADRGQAVACMTSAILHEAGFEPRAGQEAVAEVILNRLRNRAYPKTVCGVIFQGSQRRTGCQFSFTCDGSLRKLLPEPIVARAREVATRAIAGQLTPKLFGATHYHADYVSPYWAPSLIRIATVGRHIFYRQPGGLALSSVARYQSSGDVLPSGLAGARLANSPPPDVSAEKRPIERFMPWGLAPAAGGQNQATAKE